MCWTPLYTNKHKSHGTQKVKKKKKKKPVVNSGAREGYCFLQDIRRVTHI
jgi:hypothetical protein